MSVYNLTMSLMSYPQAIRLTGVQVVSQRHPMTRLNLEDLVLHIRIESCELDVLSTLSPVESHLFALVPNDELSTLVLNRQADDKRTELSVGSRSVHVRFEFTRRSRVYLQVSEVSSVRYRKLRENQNTMPHIELVQLSPDSAVTVRRLRTGE